ncbi:DUF6457 domain-containing protein [Corynebacterium sp. Q4381]|uniref:DUF6457 domain-containing protein n=1 Tax=Corynebacterium sp. Marseille-Q4381 TaxID=3121597 RepID=UPI002FE628FD
MAENKSDTSLTTTHRWLTAVAEELGIDPELVRGLVGDILDLTAAVAHNGPSRPAAPTTAFVVGLAAGAGAGDAATVRDMVARVEEMLSTYEQN